MRIALGMAAVSGLILLSLGAWGPLPTNKTFRARIVRARVTLGLPLPLDRYEFAELLYSEDDFEKALLQCEKVLAVNPRHRPALALEMELLFILGRGKATPYRADYEVYMHRSFIPSQQLLVEVDNCLERAERHRVDGNREAARIEVRKVLEFLKWMPAGCEFEARSKEAQALRATLESVYD